ncbi:fructose-bisphosphate aldolase class I [Candidatus Saccharibacteria bacterium]|nr:fructose-bisphosphate aldolase class I [Candidatus Saccharibacteria bacterium]
MNILVVGNILKDVYLSLDSRTEPFESDRHGVKWLDFAFNGSKHHFFDRMSSFGGAAISIQVLTKMGLTATVAASDFTYQDGHMTKPTPADDYRYILTSDDSISYLVGTHRHSARFEPPTAPVDYLYIDRSAFIDHATASRIKSYLDTHMNTALIIYLRDSTSSAIRELIPHANLIFTENTEVAEDSQALISSLSDIDDSKIVHLATDHLRYQQIIEPVTVARIDKLTHLSAYSIAAATVLGGFIYGRTVEESLKLARANLENSTLNDTLTLKEMEIIAAASPESLELIAATLLAPGKGILAADESGGSIRAKFATLGIPDTFENRHTYRNIFFSTPGIEQYLSGIILFDETARDFADNGETIPDYLISRRIIPGIKVDQGLVKLPDSPDETHTEGLTTLKSRLREYYEMGLRFAKWRAAFHITFDENYHLRTPSETAIDTNCRELAEYAAACQSAGLVPIVEPEVVYDGDYPITRSAEVTGKILDNLIKTLRNFGVNLHACIIKTNMILAGKRYPMQSTPSEVGKATAEVLRRYIPADIAGIVFLSGGQTPTQAADNLAAIQDNGPYPWGVTYSFARALQDPTLDTWHGDDANIPAAKDAFLETLKRL